MRTESGLLASLFCTSWVDGADTPLVRFYTSDPKAKLTAALGR